MNKIYKSVLAVAAASIVAGASMAPVAVNAWGDSNKGRTTYTLEQINNGDLGTAITFNSITNGKIGDERNFVGARIGTDTIYGKWNADTLKVSDGDVVTVRLYVHNNSPMGTNGIATGVSASVSLPTTVSNSLDIIGYLNAANANPTRYWDEVTLTSDHNFYVEYVEGSAKYTNTDENGKVREFAISDSVITSGATLGYDTMNGQIPGCYEYDGQLTIQVKVHSSVASKLYNTVRIKGETEWHESVTAKVGDEVEYQIEFENLLSDTVNNVMIRDVLPNNMEYVAGSTVLYNYDHQTGMKVKEDTLTTTGINIGSYQTHGNAYVRFTAKVVDRTLASGNNQLVNWASSTVNSTVTKDDSSVFVKKGEGTKTTTDTNDTTTRIVSTGPEGIVASALGAGSAVSALGYVIAKRRA